MGIRKFASLCVIFLIEISYGLNQTLEMPLKGLVFQDPDSRKPSSVLADMPKNFSNSIIPAGYYVVGLLNNVEIRFHIDLQTSAIYLFENYCEDCNFTTRVKDQIENWRGAVSTVAKYCQVSYRACEYYEDESHLGYFTKQQLTFDDSELEKIGVYVVKVRRGDLEKGLLASPTVFATMGLGRSDSDQKYQHSTKEEFVTRYNLQSTDVGIHFHPKGKVIIGKKLLVETLKHVNVHHFPIINTHRISMYLSGLQAIKTNEGEESKEISMIPLEVEFVISTITQNTVLPKSAFERVLNYTNETVLKFQKANPSLLTVYSKNNTIKLYVMLPMSDLYPSLPESLTKLLRFSFIAKQSLMPLELPLPFDLIECKPTVEKKNNCTFLFSVSQVTGADSPSLGLSFLYGRYMHVSADSFSVSTQIEPSLLREAPSEDTDTTGAMWGLGLGVLFAMPVFYRSVQGCLKSIGV